MSTTKLYLDLSLASTWIAEDEQSSTIKGLFEQKQDNLPKVIWAVNTIPFSEGIKSFTPVNPDNIHNLPTNDSNKSYYDLDTMIDSDGNMTYLTIQNNLLAGAGGRRKYTVYYNGAWVSIMDVVGQWSYNFHKRVTLFQNQTIFTLEGSEIFAAGVNVQGDPLTNNDLFTYSTVNNRVEVYNLVGVRIDQNEPKSGITSFQNYLLFWDTNRVYWSSPTDFTDFTPAIGGGGSTRISEAKGDILTIVPNPTGLMVYCKQNIVHAAFSGDSSNPWVFTEVAGSSGILQSTHKPIVTSSETSSIQFAATGAGLVAITDSKVTILDNKMLENFDNLEVETKAQGSSDIERVTNPLLSIATTKIYNLRIIGQNLFIFTGSTLWAFENPEYSQLGRLYIMSMVTGKITKLEGTYLSVAQLVNLDKIIDTTIFLARKTDLIPNKYLLSALLSDTVVVPIELDMASNTQRQLGTFPVGISIRPAEVLVGIVSVTRSSTTMIHSIKLDGRGHVNGDDTGRATVSVYSKSVFGATSPQEFIYNPVDDTYYGYAEAKDLMVEIKGNNFYFTGMSIEVERGGNF